MSLIKEERKPMVPVLPSLPGGFPEYFITMSAHFAGKKYLNRLTWEEYGEHWQEMMDTAFDRKVNFGTPGMIAAFQYSYEWQQVLVYQEIAAMPLSEVGEIIKKDTPITETDEPKIKSYEQYKQEYKMSKDFVEEVKKWK
jgi:hypothetical protein